MVKIKYFVAGPTGQGVISYSMVYDLIIARPGRFRPGWSGGALLRFLEARVVPVFDGSIYTYLFRIKRRCFYY